MPRPLAALGLALLLAACHARRPAPAGTPLRILVWNVHAGADAAGVPNLERVAARVRAEGADLVLLQEVDRGVRRSAGVDQSAELARLTGLHAAFGKSLDFQGGEYGVAILSRWPVARHDALPLPVDPPQPRSGGLTTPRTALVAHVETPRGRVVLVDTHIDASRDDRWRRQEAAHLARIVDSLARAEPGATVLLGGDLNSEPGSAPQALLLEAGLRDAWAECGGGAPGLTYPADVPVKRIDWLYLGGRAACRAARVLDDRASDHRALVVDVALP